MTRRSWVKAEWWILRPALWFLALAGIFYCGARAGAQTGSAAGLDGDKLQAISEMNFNVMTMKQGLPHDSVYGFAQDTAGYVWIANFGGLSRFDGYQIYNYTHDGHDPGSLPDNNVRVLLPRADGGLYVGTGSAGLSIYQPATDSFVIPAKTPSVLRKARVFCMADDGEGGVWIGTQNGFAHYHDNTGEFDLYGGLTGKPVTGRTPSGGIFALLQDKDRNLWVGSGTGLYMLGKGVGEFQFFAGDDKLGQRPSVWSIFQDHVGGIWIGTDTTGIGTVDRKSGTVHGYPGLAGEGSSVGPHTVRVFLEMQPGLLWFATYGGGLFSLDTATGQMLHWAKDPTASAPLSNDFIRGMIRDRSGVVWLGTDSGLSSITVNGRGIFNIRSSPLRPDRLYGSEVRSVGAGYGRVWVGFDQGGFAEIDRDGSIHRIKPAPGVSGDQISHREVLAIKAVDEKTVVAGGIGLYLIDVATRTYRPVDDVFLRKQIVNALLVDGDDVWAGSYNGLARYNRRTRQLKVFAHDQNNAASISDDYVRDMLKDSHGRLWVTTRLGLDLFDPATESFRHVRHDKNDPASIATDNIQPIAEDPQGRLWIGSIGAGVQVMDEFKPDGKARFRTIDHDHSNLPDDIILVIRRGLDGTMWINTPRGLAAVDPKSFTVRRYGTPDGLQSTAQNLFSSALLDDGTILFPGNSSVVIVRPQKLHPWTFAAPLVATEVTVQGVAQSPVLLARQAGAGQLSFPSHRGFEVNFALLDYTSPDDTLYSYQLEGFDDSWSVPSISRRSATYTNLPGGQYVFHIRAVSRNGAGPSQEISFPIHIRNGVTETLWFQILLILLTIGVVLLLVRVRLAYMARRQRELEAVIATRTSELESSRQELIRVNERLARIALHDELTGTLNRRGFFERASLEVSRSHRSGRGYSLLLADLDNFKQTNDTMGHSAGDATLRAIATMFASSIRTSDILSRYGGEEFILLLPETEESQALQMAERLRQMVEAAPIEYAGIVFHTTTSIGLATSTGEDESLEALISRADQGLYRAKRSGKNCVQTASGLTA